MADEIVIKYDADVKKLDDKLKGIEKEQLAIDKNAKVGGQTITDQSNKSAQALGKVEKQTKSLKNTFNDLSQHLPFAGAIQQASQLTSTLVNVGKATTGVSGTMQILKVAIASTGIGFLVIAFASLISYFKSTEAGGDRLAKIMRVVGAVFGEVVKALANVGEFLFDVGEAIVDYTSSSEKATTTTDDYRKSVTQLASEIADLEDQISALTITVELQNDKLQTSIEKSLKSLRNRNTTLQESQDLIFDIANAETQRFQNNDGLIDKEIEKERKLFILKARSLGQDEEIIRQIEVGQKNALEAGNFEQIKFFSQKLARIEEENKANIDKVKLFDQFVEQEIDAETLLNNTKELFTEEDVKRIAEILKRREAAAREKLVLDERLQNFEDAALEKERAREEKRKQDREKANQDADKAFQEKVKRIAQEEKLALGFAKIQGASEGELIEIEQKFNQQRIDLFKEANKTQTFEYKELILEQQKLDKDYSDFLKKEWKARLDEFNKQEEKKKNDAVNKGKETGKLLSGIIKKQNDEAIAEEKRKEAEIKAIRQQSLQEAISLTTQALNGINDLQLAKANAEIETERQAQDKITQDRLTAIDTRVKAGVISETQANSQKAKIQRDAAKKESELKRKQFEAEQKASINRINISTAEAVVKTLATYGFTPLAAVGIAAAIATGEIQKAIVRSQPVPKFEKGGKVLKGKSHREGGILIEAEGGERIFSRKTTKQYEPLFKSIQEGYFDKYADENFVRPALKRERERNRIKEERDKAAYDYMRSMTLNGLVDTSHLERLTKKNKSVNINNPDVIKDAVKNGMSEALNRRNRGI
jgi:hypothetical protein